MLRPRVPTEPDTATEPKKTTSEDLTSPRPSENVEGIAKSRAHIWNNPPGSPGGLNPEELRKLRIHNVTVERRRSLALTYHRRNAMR